MAKRGSASSRFAKLIRYFNFQQRTVVDPNTQEETIEEIPVLENVSLEASTDVTVAGEQVVTTASQYVTAESNDLSSAVTWANVPDANITQSSVTQHQAALSITESQISDLQNYLTTPFPSGTRMLFQQTTAPTGWTKDTTHNNKALRVTSGTVTSGGTHSFGTVFSNSRNTGNKRPALQSHRHYAFHNSAPGTGSMGLTSTTSAADQSGYPSNYYSYYVMARTGSTPNVGYTNYQGGDSDHNHNMDLRVNYVDVIFAVKD